MRVYRIRLKGTELYYQPTKGKYNGEKSNLSEKGKVYLTRPSLKHIGRVAVSDALHKRHPELDVKQRLGYRRQGTLCNPVFEIVEYEMREVSR